MRWTTWSRLEVYNNSTIVNDELLFHLRTLFATTIGSAGVSLINSFTQDTDSINLILRLINSNSLILTVDNDGQLNIELPSTATIPGLYVNSLYKPTYEDFLNVNNQGKGEGTLAKPFTNTRTYTNATTYTDAPNTAIQNALNAYVNDPTNLGSTGTRLNPDLSGQQIIVQNNNNLGYRFDGDFNYTNLNLLNQSFISSTTSDYLVNMDNSSYFNSTTSRVIINNEENATLRVKKGFLNSGNTVNGVPTYTTGRILYFLGKGQVAETENYSGNNVYLLNSDPNGTANGILGCNNNGNFAIEVTETNFFSLHNGLYKIGGKSRIGFSNSKVSSSIAGADVNTNLVAFHQIGGEARVSNCEIFLGGDTGRTTGFLYEPTSTFQTNSYFRVRNSQFSGSAVTWFKKNTTFNFNFDVISCNTLFFNGTQLFNSPNLWSINFNNNVFEEININFNIVDFTQGNNKSSSNTIGSNIVQQLVRWANRTQASLVLPKGSLFINTNGNPIDGTPSSLWKIDIVI